MSISERATEESGSAGGASGVEEESDSVLNLVSRDDGSLREECSSVEEALDLIPDELKAAYLSARSNAPQVVAQDTPVARFLAVEAGSYTKAAKRLCLYWKKRVGLFGDRAERHLDMTEEGALEPVPLKLTAMAGMCLLPPDTRGRPVLAFCQSMFTDEYLEPEHARNRLLACFYYASVASEHPVAQSQGIVLLSSIVGNYRPESNQLFSELIRDCLPVRRLELHVIFLPSLLPKVDRVRWTIVDIYHRNLGPTAAPLIHHAETDTETIASVAEHGIQPSSIPVWLGGQWTIEDFHRWRERRLSVERKRKMTKEEKKMMKRQAEVERARRRREAELCDLEGLRSQVGVLSSQKEMLRLESARLEALLSYAHSIVATSLPMNR